MKKRAVTIYSGLTLEVPENICRIDSKRTHGWQLRYGEWKMFSDGPDKKNGAMQSLKLATDELVSRIKQIDAPTGLRKSIISIKTSDLPVGISGPISRKRKDRTVTEYYFGVTIPRFDQSPGNTSVYIGTENTYSQEKYDNALEKGLFAKRCG